MPRTTKPKAWAHCRNCGKAVYLVGEDAERYEDAPHRGAVHFTCDLAVLDDIPSRLGA